MTEQFTHGLSFSLMKPVEDLEMILSMASDVDGTTCGRKEQNKSIVGTSAWMSTDDLHLYNFFSLVIQI